ncbi:MAG TPA: carboxy terminal-processing peptidase [Verrucomicrobiae bacterium]|jgi:carboxyl-terminal processing protease|nr:carboxy terminal-processing peptidase [Verrucomicrobiae bacterium]
MRLSLFPAAWRLTLSLLALPFAAASVFADSTPAAAPVTDATIGSTDSTYANIAWVTAEMLQSWHYSRHPFDAEISSKFYDRYLDSLDYFHLYFLQSDVQEFETYRTNLSDLTRKKHELTPCWSIFSRFMARANARVAYVTNFLTTEKMEFNGHDRFVPDRHLLPYPKDEAEEREFWRQAARTEFLDEKLKSPDVKYEGKLKDATAAAPDVLLARDKAHPLTFSFLPAKFYGKDGHEIATVAISADQSNAVVHLDWTLNREKKTTNTIFSEAGEELGTVATHFVASSHTNAAEEAATNRVYETNLAVIIQLNQKDVPEVVKTLTTHYVQMLKNYKELDNDRVFEIYMNSLAHAYDPHSDYMGHMQAEDFSIQMKLSLTGIGAVLGSEDGYCKITDLKDGPAMRSGKIKPNDRIVAVAQSNAEPINVVGMPLGKVVQMIRGPKGTKVTLTMIPSDAADSSARKTVSLVREEIKLEDQAAKARLYETKSPQGKPEKLGVIDLSSFYANPDAEAEKAGSKTTSIDVARLIKRLKQEHVDGLVLDLRRNGGGYLEEAIKLTGLFIAKGPVVQTKDFNGETTIDSDPDPSVLYDGPLIVLTSRLSASASEILAGALQDYGRAVMVGDKTTFGKGTVQTIQPLGPLLEAQRLHASFDPGELKVTIKKFYRAGGASTQLKGVVSDVELPSYWSYADVGESSLPNAMPWDEVTTADFDDLNRVKPYLGELQSRSRQRVEADPEFDLIRDRIDRYKKDMADKSVSLNEKERVAEQKKMVERNDQLKALIAAHKAAPQKVYEITLKNVDSPGLSAPVVKTNSVALKEAHDEEFDIDDELSAHEAAGDIDPALEETKRILMDYIDLRAKAPGITKADATAASNN